MVFSLPNSARYCKLLAHHPRHFLLTLYVMAGITRSDSVTRVRNSQMYYDCFLKKKKYIYRFYLQIKFEALGILNLVEFLSSALNFVFYQTFGVSITT